MPKLGTKTFGLSLQPKNIQKIDNVRGNLIGRSTVIDILLTYLPEDSIKSIIHGTNRINSSNVSFEDYVKKQEELSKESETKNVIELPKKSGFVAGSSDTDFQVSAIST